MTRNATSRKRCIFEACTVTMKKLHEHVERTHILWSVSRQCLDLEKAQQFPTAESTKALSAADQENMHLFEQHINVRRANFLMMVSPPNSVGSLIHWRLIAGLMNYLGHQDTTTLTPIEQQIPLSGILYRDVVDSHCHLLEFLQGKKGLEVQGLRKAVYNYGLKVHQNVNIAALVSSHFFPDEVPYPDAAARATWKVEEIPVYCCLGLHPKVCNEPRDDLLDQLDQQLMSLDVGSLADFQLSFIAVTIRVLQWHIFIA